MSVTVNPKAIGLMLGRMPAILQANKGIVERSLDKLNSIDTNVFSRTIKVIDTTISKLLEDMQQFTAFQAQAEKLNGFLSMKEWKDPQIEEQEGSAETAKANKDEIFLDHLQCAGIIALAKIDMVKSFFEEDLQVISKEEAKAPAPLLVKAICSYASKGINYEKEVEKHPIFSQMDFNSKKRLIMKNKDKLGNTDWRNIYNALMDEASAVSTPVRVEEPSNHLLNLEKLETAINQCITILDDRQAYRQEGIFRLSGSMTSINELKKQFNSEKGILQGQLIKSSNDDIACFLKWIVREINERPEGIFEGSNDIKVRIAERLKYIQGKVIVTEEAAKGKEGSRLTEEAFNAATAFNFSYVIIKFGKQS